MTTAVSLVLLGALSRLLPHPPNFVPLGALALYSGARLPAGWDFAVPLFSLALSDFFLDFGTGRALLSPGRVAIYGSFLLIVLAGRLLRGKATVKRLAAFSVASSLLFFFVSNLAVFLRGALYPRTGAGFFLCYAAALPFFWNTLSADLLGTATLFGVDAMSRKRRAATRGAAAASLIFLLAVPALAQAPPPVSDSLVVTATMTPEEERDLGSAATVITREWIEASGARTVVELLREVPGVDVARQGSDGALTSVFLRGANSPHLLVLVDGARMNSPYFSGYDFSSLTTENIERIEVVRGPFSPLYGSDAIGGVIQIFTRPSSARPAGRATAEGGSEGQRGLAAFVSAGVADFAAAASFSDSRSDGHRRNSDWEERGGSLRLDWRPNDVLQIGLEGALRESEVGIPGPVGGESPRARQEDREERLQVPIRFRPASGHDASFLFARVASERLYTDPDSDFASESRPETLQARVSDTFRAGRHELTAFGSWERWRVSDRSNFGTSLDDDSSTLWGGGVQDIVSLGRGLVLTAGVRYDRHSDFGEAWSPRGTLAWVDGSGRWKLRASAGSAFRAPSVGELFYPFSGNPDLEPERVTSYEVGAARFLGAGSLELSLFWNEYRNLIVFEFSTSLNENVGRARTRGAELIARVPVGERAELKAGYTWLDAEDRQTGEDLLRRPRHRAAAAVAWRPLEGWTVTPRIVFVGRRADADPLTRARVSEPSYLRLDLFTRYDLGLFEPFARVENVTDRGYQEVRGYPAPGRRFSGGLEVRF
ncbi:MAG: TonB-dependent receptor domain-containing protein [Thermoanaerobaculia bacterium]